MRIGSTVLLKQQVSIQSYEWEYFRPLGQLQTVLDSLEEYMSDEISIIRPVRANDTHNDFMSDIETLRNIKTMTPISFGGGIRTSAHIELLRGLPIERLVFSSAFIDKNQELIIEGKDLFGHQAIQCLLPLKLINNELYVYHSSISDYIPFAQLDLDFILELANEIVLIDLSNEGQADKFQWELVELSGLPKSKLVISGGVGKNTIKMAAKQKIASVLIDNKTLHKEYSILSYKNA
jgi:imidazole glycerol phosphate synthase subunit HisF